MGFLRRGQLTSDQLDKRFWQLIEGPDWLRRPHVALGLLCGDRAIALKGRRMIMLDLLKQTNAVYTKLSEDPILRSLYTVLQQIVEKLHFSQTRRHYYSPVQRVRNGQMRFLNDVGQ